MELITQIDERISYLKKVITREKKSLQYAPEGSLRGTAHGCGWQYYCRQGRENGTYIPKDHMDLAQKLGQKGYNRKVLAAAEQEAGILEQVRDYYQASETLTVEEVFDSLPPWHRQVVTPLTEPWEDFVKRWEGSIRKAGGACPEDDKYLSSDGTRMRSKSEELIAAQLRACHIPFAYEKPLILKGYGRIYPDFSTLHPIRRQEVYWEHLGLIADDNYRKTAFAKIADFERNGYLLGVRLIITYETPDRPLSEAAVKQKIETYLLK